MSENGAAAKMSETLLTNDHSNSATDEKERDEPMGVRDDPTELISEWRISVGWALLPVSVSPGFKAQDFRNQEGRSILARQDYFSVLNGARDLCKFAYFKLTLLYVFLSFAGTLVPLIVLVLCYPGEEDDNNDDINDDNNHNNNDINNSTVLIMLASSFLVCFGIYDCVATRVYKRLDQDLEDFVALKKEELLTMYGLTIGYRRMPWSWSWSWSWSWWRSTTSDTTRCVWLQAPNGRIPTATPASPDSDAETSQGARSYPPIFIAALGVPGDLSISDKDYHASMIYDEATWNLIKETHKKHVADAGRPGGFLLSTFGAVFLAYGLFFSFISHHLGVWKANVGLFFFFLANHITFHAATQWVAKAYENVAEKVTLVLNDSGNASNSPLMGYTMQLVKGEMSDGGGGSFRYEMVPNVHSTLV